MSGPQTPTPNRPPPQGDVKKNPLGYIIPRWKDFSAKSLAGKLGADHEKSIRTILSQAPRSAVVQGLLLHRINIFENMNPALDPRLEHGGPPTLSHEQFVRENALALEDIKKITMRNQLAAAAAAAQSQAGSGTVSGASTPIKTAQQSSPAGTPQPQPQAQLAGQAVANSSLNPNATAGPLPRPPNAIPAALGRPPIRAPGIPGGLMDLSEVRVIVSKTPAERKAHFDRSPGLQQRFNLSVAHYQMMQKQGNVRPPGANGPGRPPTGSAPSTAPSTPSSSQGHNQAQTSGPSNPQNQSHQARPPPQTQTQTPARPPPQGVPGQNQQSQQNHATNPHGATPTPNPNPASNAIPARPFNLNLPPQRQAPPAPPPIPIENEKVRRRRKFREYVREEAPGLEIEVGVDQIVSDYLDAFIDEAARGAIRLAKHRKGNKVELKDMALYLDVTHDMRLPGFNVQLPQRHHISADSDKKRGKAVAPRAARKGKEAE